MNRGGMVWIGIGAALAIAFIALALTPGAKASNDPPSYGGAVYGDWTVTDTRTYTGAYIELYDGNLVINAGASLTLNATTLVFCPSADGKYGIDDNAKGTLKVVSGSTITSWDTNNHYYFKVNGPMTIDNSYIYEVWGDSSSWKGGIQIFSSQVTISNSEISLGRTGGISIFDCSPEITDNYIHGNGADGKSTYFTYGIYGTNTHGNITGNEISENDYAEGTKISSGYIWPDGYEVYWNGHWWYYYWWSGYYARQEQLSIIDISTHFGKGVYIEGGSTTKLANNTIEKNGWGVFEATGWTYDSYWEDWEHYVDSYTETYKIPSCAGIGVYSGNSSLKLVNNKIDRNGYEPVTATYQDWQSSKTYYSVVSGTAVKLVNSFGDIQNNTISNGAILIDNYRSSPNITGNNLLSDYGVDLVNAWQGNGAFIPGKVGYTIKNYECTPYIANNTIKSLSQDYGWYDYATGQEVYSIDKYIVIENYKCPNMRIENNKITMETKNYGHVVAIGINATLKSTNMTLRGNTIEYKWSAQWNTGTLTNIPMKLVQTAFLSDVYMEGNTLKGPGQAAGGGNPSPRAVGVQGMFGSAVTMVNNKFTGLDAMVFRDFASASLKNVTVTGIPYVGIQALGSASVVVRDSSITGNARGMEVVKSSVDVYDTTLNSPLEFSLDKASSVNLYNTRHTKGAVQLVDPDSFFNVSWPIQLTVLWQNDLPVDGAQVAIKDMQSGLSFTGTTNETGMPAASIWIKEFFGHNQVLARLTPHRVLVTKARVSAMDLFMMDGPLSISFRLVDTIPPELQVLRPLDGGMLNSSVAIISGTASDPESGLEGSAVQINIDNKGFIPVAVVDGVWSYARPLSDGLHIARIMASDIVGNQVRQTFSFTIDTAGPVLQIFSPLDGSSTNQRTIAVSGISEVGALVTLNGLPATLEKRSFSKLLSLEDGPNVISVTATDASGNARTVLVHVMLDTHAPLLDIKEPRPGSAVNQNPVSVAGNTEPGAIVKVNGARVQLVDTGFEALVDLSEGANTISVTSADAAGNVNGQTFLLYLDTAAPDLNLFTPRDNLWTNRTRVLVSGATESGTSVTVNGQNVNVLNTLFSIYVPLVEGPNKVTVSAKDPAGNRLTMARMIYLDTRTPELVVSSPAEGSALDNLVVPVLGSVDWGTDVFVNGELMIVKDFVFSTTVLAREDGPFTIEVVARDQAGNTATVVRSVRLDTVSPSVTITYPEDGMKVGQRIITVSGQTEPYSTVVINTGTMISVGRDGIFSLPVALEDGENRITVTATDASGNSGTGAKIVYKRAPAAVVKQDLSWVLNLTGLFIGIGVGLPVATYMLTSSWDRRRQKVLSEVEAAESARKERVAEQARKAALPTLERMGRPGKPVPEVEQKAPAETEPMPEAPKAETTDEPAAVKTGLRDKSKTTEVSPDEIDQATRMEAPAAAPEAPKAPEPPQDPASLKDKGGEAEGDAGETDLPGMMNKD